MSKIRVGIVGYGNLGRGLEKNIGLNDDMDLVAIFTRRDPESIKSSVKVESFDNIKSYKDKIDLMFLCGGSFKDLREQTCLVNKDFNTVDSFDNHGEIPDYFKEVDKSARESGNLSLISTGWDPGLFSLARVLFSSILPKGRTYTFWGKGLSQGHSDALRRLPGVIDGVQYTIPLESSINQVKSGSMPDLDPKTMHERVCYVVAKKEDQARIKEEIVNMPNYFQGYKTQVNFISQEEFNKNHKGMPHGGRVIHSGLTGNNLQTMTLSLDLGSNPEFTSAVLIAFGRGLVKMSRDGKSGAISVYDIPLGYLARESMEDLRKNYL